MNEPIPDLRFTPTSPQGEALPIIFAATTRPDGSPVITIELAWGESIAEVLPADRDRIMAALDRAIDAACWLVEEKPESETGNPREAVVPRVRRADADATRAALASLSPFDQAAGLERWIEVACKAAGCEPDALLGFGRGRGHMPRDTSAVRAAICEYARTFGLRYVDLAARFKASRSALLSAAKSQRDKRNRREVAA